ncbi:MAG TPA: DUF1467 family protein [Beijerinckiaceae bacterium]|jgi:predicted secreted protein
MMALVQQLAASRGTTVAVVSALATVAIAFAIGVFGLSIVGAMGLYFIVWWIGLFAILPLGVRSQWEAGEVAAGTEPGAPTAPDLNEKAIWTTVLADVVYLGTLAVLPLSGL